MSVFKKDTLEFNFLFPKMMATIDSWKKAGNKNILCFYLHSSA